MPHPFDAASKHMIHAHPADWLALAGLPPGTSMQVSDSDVSLVNMAVDKLIRVEGPNPYGVHFEFQTTIDYGLDLRLLAYNAVIRRRLELPVRSVVFLLRPQAFNPAITGQVRDPDLGGYRMDFRYQLIRVWELPTAPLLSGGIGTLPLAPISAVNEANLPTVVDTIDRRFNAELPPVEVRELWTATRILMGLKWPREILGQVLKGVRNMRESVAYQEIVNEGVAEGIEIGRIKGREEGRVQGRQEGLEEGLEKGREKGREQGRVTEAKAILLQGATIRFGEPDAGARAKLDSIQDLQTLERMNQRLFKGANSWDQLFE